MNYIKKFEIYSFPDSLSELNGWIDAFVIDKFKWWSNRRSLANYTEDFVFYIEDMGIEMSEDFPVTKMKISLSFTIRSDKDWGATGMAYDFKRKGDIDVDCVLSEYRYKELVPSMKINIYSNKNIDTDDIIQHAKSSIRHELTHLYEFFKIKKSGGNPKYIGDMSQSIIDVMIKIDKSPLTDFLFVCYFLSSRAERSAVLSEYTIDDIPFKDRGIRSSDTISKIMSTPKDEYISSISYESPKDKVYKIFMESYKALWPPRKRSKAVMKCEDYDSLIDHMYNETIKNLPKWIKKLNKIKYQSMQRSK